MSDVPDLLAILQRSIDAAKRDRKKASATDCRFASLAEHETSECPLCNPDDWTAKP